MAGFSGSDLDDESFSGINVTPLVDVVLVLLVIFMMTAPLIYQNSILVQLPKARSGERSQNTPLQFYLSRDGALTWGKDVISWETLSSRLSALESAKDQSAMISADQATPHGVVVRLMDALRNAGLTKFALSVDSSVN